MVSPARIDRAIEGRGHTPWESVIRLGVSPPEPAFPGASEEAIGMMRRDPERAYAPPSFRAWAAQRLKSETVDYMKQDERSLRLWQQAWMNDRQA